MKPVAVPDLHGRLDLLEAVLSAFPGREFVFLGDYLDRGPDSRGVIEAVLALHTSGRAELLLGNHEVMAAEALSDEAARSLWLTNGGGATVRSYLALGEAGLDLYLEHLRALFAVMRPWLVSEGVLYAHAARPSPSTLAGGEDNQAHLWARPSDGLYPLPEGTSLSVHGHTVQRRPRLDLGRGVAYLDLGGRSLAVLDAEAMDVVTLGARAARRS